MKERNTTLWLGAEGCAEADDHLWLRPATEKEIADLRAETSREDFDELSRDHNRRPYWLMTVTGDAPDAIWNFASSRLRAVRLES